MTGLIIRPVKTEEVDRLSEIEAACFPPEEAAPLEALLQRYGAFPENFLAAEADGLIVGFINGCTTDSPVLYDDLYHDAGHHKPDGPNLTVFGLDVLPDYQNQGIAARLMEAYIAKARSDGRKAVILTCKDHLVHYYQKFGFVCGGVSGSTHGGAVWYDMTLTL